MWRTLTTLLTLTTVLAQPASAGPEWAQEPGRRSSGDVRRPTQKRAQRPAQRPARNPEGARLHAALLKRFDANGDGKLDAAEAGRARAALDARRGDAGGGRGRGRDARGGDERGRGAEHIYNPKQLKELGFEYEGIGRS